MTRILVTGSGGMLGSTLAKGLLDSPAEVLHPRRSELDLSDSGAVAIYMEKNRPDVILHCAALVGGIQMNIDSRSILLTENLKVDYNLIIAASRQQTPRFIYVGSSCMYPANLGRSIVEEDLLSGPIESTNYYYGLAKIIGTELIGGFREQLGLNWTSLIVSNLYGPNDNFHPVKAHLIASIIQKVVTAKTLGLGEIELWGDGLSRREFTYSEDLADWIVRIVLDGIELPAKVNVGYGKDFSVLEWYQMVMGVLDYKGQLRLDLTKPNGNRNKLLDSSVARNFGWNPSTSPSSGIQKTVDWYLKGREHA